MFLGKKKDDGKGKDDASADEGRPSECDEPRSAPVVSGAKQQDKPIPADGNKPQGQLPGTFGNQQQNPLPPPMGRGITIPRDTSQPPPPLQQQAYRLVCVYLA